MSNDKAKHTPGPWFFGNTHIEGERLILGGPDRDYVCTVRIHQTPRHLGGYTEATREANALLMAAAPAMWSELKKVVFHLIRDDFSGNDALRKQAIDSIEKTIAKAEGGAP